MKIFHLPDLGEGLAEAEIHQWYVNEGDQVKVDQPLVSVETAKALVDIPSPMSGKIIKLYGKKGDILKAGQPLLEYQGSESSADKGTVVGQLEESNELLQEKEVIVGAVKKTSHAVKAMPAVRALAKELNIALETIKPTGAQGQITLDDVKKMAPGAQTSSKAEALHGVKRAMALAATQSAHEIVPVTLMDDADITLLGSQGDITVNLLQAMVAAVAKEPALNAWYDSKTMTRTLHQEVHIGLAVDTPEGLFVPVIKEANHQNAQTLRKIIDDFKKSVQARTLTPNDLQGATITLTNFGMFAGRYASPMIIPPMAAILGCGRIRDEARVYQGNIAIRRVAPLSLTFDHRIVTGGEASRFLGALIACLEAKISV